MPQYLIERAIPRAGQFSKAELGGIARRSCAVLRELGPAVQWVESYVTADKIYCIYRAPDETLIRDHAEKGGFPVDSIARVETVIDPTTAEA